MRCQSVDTQHSGKLFFDYLEASYSVPLSWILTPQRVAQDDGVGSSVFFTRFHLLFKTFLSKKKIISSNRRPEAAVSGREDPAGGVELFCFGRLF